MGIVETKAVVIQTFKLADADKIAVCMTEKAGLIRGVARGARRLKSKFGASLEPFTLIRLTYFEKESRELVTIKESEILKSYFGAAKDSEAHGASAGGEGVRVLRRTPGRAGRGRLHLNGRRTALPVL